jgi:hypothetical protein
MIGPRERPGLLTTDQALEYIGRAELGLPDPLPD